MDISLLSNTFDVRSLSTKDIDLIYSLSCKNKIFYQYHPPFVTKESIQEDLKALPPGKDYKDKYYVGFFDDEILVAIMDLILDYPTKNISFIGLFMMNLEYQNKGLGSKIISECAKCLKASRFHKIRLGVDKENPQSHAFWKKNSFTVTDENDKYIVMELIL